MRKLFLAVYFASAHLDLAAFRAIALRLFGDSFSARAFPPFNHPSFPSATAARFLLDFVPVLFATISAASWFTSFAIHPVMLERTGMRNPL